MAERRATDDDILALPEHLVGEVLHGALYTHARPAPKHARAYSALGYRSTAATDRAVKMPIYAREQVRFLWLIDPDARTLETYERQGDGHWLLLGTLSEDADVSLPPFETTVFSLDRLWPWAVEH